MADRERLNFSRLEDGEDLRKVWNKAGSSPRELPVSDREIEAGLEAVHNTLGWDGTVQTRKKTDAAGRFWLTSRYMVAAIALLVFGAYFLFVPISITVPHGEIATLEMPDGSTVELNSGSTLSYSRLFGWNNRKTTLNGEGFFSVKSSEHPFTVEANGTVTEVTGTQFNIRSWLNDPGMETVITVAEGEVYFYPVAEKNRNVVLSQGQLSKWNLELDEPTQAESITRENIAGWRNQKLIFNEQPLIAIFHELERRYDVRIDLEISGSEYEKLTAYYNQPQSIRAILDDISLVKDFRYAETANGFRVFK